jgi:hypothetical protein
VDAARSLVTNYDRFWWRAGGEISPGSLISRRVRRKRPALGMTQSTLTGAGMSRARY